MKILMVCLGNICRSPLAEGIMAQKLKRYKDEIFVDSAGTGAWHVGEHPDKRSVAVAKKHGMDISYQRARQITVKDLDTFDLVFTMDKEVYQDVITMAKNPNQKSKVHLLLEYAGIPDKDTVPDPYWGGSAEFEEVYQLLEDACERIRGILIRE